MRSGVDLGFVVDFFDGGKRLPFHDGVFVDLSNGFREHWLFADVGEELQCSGVLLLLSGLLLLKYRLKKGRGLILLERLLLDLPFLHNLQAEVFLSLLIILLHELLKFLLVLLQLLSWKVLLTSDSLEDLPISLLPLCDLWFPTGLHLLMQEGFEFGLLKLFVAFFHCLCPVYLLQLQHFKVIQGLFPFLASDRLYFFLHLLLLMLLFFPYLLLQLLGLHAGHHLEFVPFLQSPPYCHFFLWCDLWSHISVESFVDSSLLGLFLILQPCNFFI